MKPARSAGLAERKIAFHTGGGMVVPYRTECQRRTVGGQFVFPREAEAASTGRNPFRSSASNAQRTLLFWKRGLTGSNPVRSTNFSLAANHSFNPLRNVRNRDVSCNHGNAITSLSSGIACLILTACAFHADEGDSTVASPAWPSSVKLSNRNGRPSEPSNTALLLI
jgi:hypothetical protein